MCICDVCHIHSLQLINKPDRFLPNNEIDTFRRLVLKLRSSFLKMVSVLYKPTIATSSRINTLYLRPF